MWVEGSDGGLRVPEGTGPRVLLRGSGGLSELVRSVPSPVLGPSSVYPLCSVLEPVSFLLSLWDDARMNVLLVTVVFLVGRDPEEFRFS